ncbi:glycosyltransferase family 4 protein [Sphingomonas sp. H39-1-10]|uniref:glycosyltransferase family 4 protein n=1 Tax=Sphingomonas pollutisoli TaxID=3030829 RepID=UPI0023B9BEDB|nr:glycosyltransferase family 4 protein [Sphingomonas pollutisoli]MDF0487667.1 glycosyltransferase family 4 protein [Sphingomonas pollutisoli]
MIGPPGAADTPTIVYLYGQTLPNKAANSGAVIGLCSALAALGERICVVSPDGGGTTAEITATYQPHPRVRFRNLSVPDNAGHYPAYAAALRRPEFARAIIITRMPQVALLTAALGRRTVLELHQHSETYKHWAVWRRLLHLVRSDRLRVAALSQGVVDELDPLLRRKGGEPAMIASAARDFAGGADIRPRYDIGFIGSFMPGKGVGFVETIARLAPHYSVVLYGDPSRDPPSAARLAALPNVTLAGYVNPTDVGAALASFRVGLAPYERAGFGGDGAPFVRADDLSSLKIVEYLSARRIVVASRIPSVERMVADRHSAMLCDPDDPADWIRAIDTMFAEPALAAHIAATGRALYEHQFSFDIRARRFRALIDQLR